MTLKQQIFEADKIYREYSLGVHKKEKALQLLHELEIKAYDEDPDAEPDGDYTYTVAVIMEKILDRKRR